MTLDDADVHLPMCKWCWECQWCLGLNRYLTNTPQLEFCPHSPDGKHEFVWEGLEDIDE